MAESMNDFFVNVGNTVEAKIPQGDNHFSKFLKNTNPKSIFLNPVDNSEVTSLINQIQSSRSCGPNSIPSKILKTNVNILSIPLELIINKSLNEGVFPKLMKSANVCPIFKKGDKKKCENYRPISLLSNLSKIFERLMHIRLYEFLEKSKIFYESNSNFERDFQLTKTNLGYKEQFR